MQGRNARVARAAGQFSGIYTTLLHNGEESGISSCDLHFRWKSTGAFPWRDQREDPRNFKLSSSPGIIYFLKQNASKTYQREEHTYLQGSFQTLHLSNYLARKLCFRRGILCYRLDVSVAVNASVRRLSQKVIKSFLLNFAEYVYINKRHVTLT